MFNATQYIIDKVRRITQINLATGLVDFTGTSVASPQIEFTGESTDKTDAQGILLARFDTVNLTTEGTHPFSFTALKDYCADDADLCYILFEE